MSIWTFEIRSFTKNDILLFIFTAIINIYILWTISFSIFQEFFINDSKIFSSFSTFGQLFIDLFGLVSKMCINMSSICSLKSKLQILEHQITGKPTFILPAGRSIGWEPRNRIICINTPTSGSGNTHNFGKNILIHTQLLPNGQRFSNSNHLYSKWHIITKFSNLSSPSFTTIEKVFTHTF